MSFIPALQRRRLSRISKMALHVAREACTSEELGDIGLVFASRHGEVQMCDALLKDIARGLPLSPTAFSHSVHNAPVGAISISFSNRAAASSISAQRATFSAGLIEACACSFRRAGTPVLLLVADEPPCELAAPFRDELAPCYAVACKIAVDVASHAELLDLELVTDAPPLAANVEALPDALRFANWMTDDARSLDLVGVGDARWRITRAHSGC